MLTAVRGKEKRGFEKDKVIDTEYAKEKLGIKREKIQKRGQINFAFAIAAASSPAK